MQKKSKQRPLVQLQEMEGNQVKQVLFRSLEMAQMIVDNHKKGQYVIVEQPKVSRNPETMASKTTSRTETATKSPAPAFEDMSKDELMSFIQACETIEHLQILTGHALKSVAKAAEARIKELNQND